MKESRCRFLLILDKGLSGLFDSSCYLSFLKRRGAMLRWIIILMFVGICAGAAEPKKKTVKPNPISKGWGDEINWVQSYGEGLSKAVKSQKPLIVIHHKDECPYSQALKKAFVANDTIQKMAKDEFIMINLVEETMDKNLAPDGYYVPRILFVDPSLTVRADITGRYGNRHYAYAPEDLGVLLSNMKKAKVLLHNEL
ncbi:anterior gradient 1 [Oryzias melastigma]|uniref:Anterior gradient 1 n=1 Tax=Oryzias melastigma TaxID=30732 RepID=A0A3B3DD13_ORYME|nr:anterior gradient 1 [Oryzias melastigma]